MAFDPTAPRYALIPHESTCLALSGSWKGGTCSCARGELVKAIRVEAARLTALADELEGAG
jgi:hypothetical protein